jgi:hypothetical protein
VVFVEAIEHLLVFLIIRLFGSVLNEFIEHLSGIALLIKLTGPLIVDLFTKWVEHVNLVVGNSPVSQSIEDSLTGLDILLVVTLGLWVQ